MASHLSSVWIVLALLCSKVISTYACYFPNGDIASTHVPCSPNGDGGCCVSGDFCTAFGYCVSNSKGYHYRGACTDSTWGNPSCPDYCLAGTSSGNSSVVNVIACNAASTSGSWCCAYNGNCCSGSTFVPTFGTIFAEPGSSSTSSSSSSQSTSSSIASTSATQTSASSTSSSTTQGSPQNTTTGGTTNKGSSNTGAIVGAAVGVPLGIAVLAALYLFWRERNKRKNMEHVITEKDQPDSYNIQQQNGFGHEMMGQGGNMGTSPLIKRFEMNSERGVELSGGHDAIEIESPGSIPGYGQHGQDTRR